MGIASANITDAYGVSGSATAFRATIAQSVEGASGYDPSGILVSASDTANGVSISISGAAADGPELGVSWSVPAKGILGGSLAPLGTASGRSALSAVLAAVQRAAWSSLATPNNRMYWVGIADGPIETCSNAMVFCVENVVAGEQRISTYRKTGGTWNSPSAATTGSAAVKGVVGVPSGVPVGSGDNVGYAAGCAVPYEGLGPFTDRVLLTAALNLADGTTPHVIFGAGGPVAGTADTIEFAPLLAALRVEDLEDLVA